MARALLSVSDKSGLVPFARGLAARGFELVSTGGTAKVLQLAGLSVVPVADVTGFPEMMDGRVKTLHPLVHGGILAQRSRPDHLAAASAQGITLIDLVVVNLYPFARAAANPATTAEGLIEEIDIGGPSLVRAAAKNFADVLVVVAPGDYDAVLDQIDRAGGPALSFRLALAQKAFAHTASYDSMIASTLLTLGDDGSGLKRTATPAADTLFLELRKVRDLRYGENPHQKAAWYAEQPPYGFGAAQLLQGLELSYTNLLDLDAALRIVLEFAEPAAVVIKHTNPCGAATGTDILDAYVRARAADPLSAFGGIIGLNRPIDGATADAIVATKIDAVVAPSVDEDAAVILGRKSAMRVLTVDFPPRDAPHSARDARSLYGAVLMQTADRVVEAEAAWPGDHLRVVTRRQPTADEWTALRFAWRLCAHVKSNTIIFTGADRTLAIGAGQMSRVDAAKVAVMKAEAAGVSLAGSVAASDAFIPFRDGLDAIAASGATAVVQPGGSVKDAEVIAAADEHGLAMVFTGRRHFRH